MGKKTSDANKSDSFCCQILKRNHVSPFQLSPNVSMQYVYMSHFEGLNRKNAKLRHVKMLPQTSYKILTYLQWWWFQNCFDWTFLMQTLSVSDLQSFRIYTVLIRVVMERQNNRTTNALETSKLIIFRWRGKKENSSHSFSWARRFDYILFYFGFFSFFVPRFCLIQLKFSLNIQTFKFYSWPSLNFRIRNEFCELKLWKPRRL